MLRAARLKALRATSFEFESIVAVLGEGGCAALTITAGPLHSVHLLRVCLLSRTHSACAAIRDGACFKTPEHLNASEECFSREV